MRRRLNSLNTSLGLSTSFDTPWLVFLYLGRPVCRTVRLVKTLSARLNKYKDVMTPANFFSALSEQTLRRHGLTATEPPSATVEDVEKAVKSFGFAEDQPGFKTAGAKKKKKSAGKRRIEDSEDENEGDDDADDNHGEGQSTNVPAPKRRKTRSMAAAEAGRSRPSNELTQLDISSTFINSPSSLAPLDFGDDSGMVADTSLRRLGSNDNDNDIYQANLVKMRDMVEHCGRMINQFEGNSFAAQQAVFAHQAVRAMVENAVRTTEEYIRERDGIEEGGGVEQDGGAEEGRGGVEE